jgi:ATP-dependent helicase/nuclease subunit B
MPAQVSVLAGPARSGKTATLLTRYRKLLAEQPNGNAAGAALWIAPTKYAATEIREQLLDGGLGGCFNPGVYTFEQFGQSLLAASDEPPRYLGRLLKRQLIARLLAEFQAGDRLHYFAPIADTAGLIDLIDGLISDLKRQQISPDTFSQIIESVAPSEKNREIAALYAEYQQLLDRHQMHDIEGRFWSAANFLRTTPPKRWGLLANVKLVVFDGFTDFTRSQHEFLSVLVTRAVKLEELIVTLPLEESTDRKHLFDKPRHTLKELQSRHKKMRIHWQPRSSETTWPGLSHLERNLFCNPREVKPAAETDRIEIIAAAGQKAEIEVIARRIKSLLKLGDEANQARKVHPGDAAVVFRSVEPLAPLVEEVFAEYGIPVAIDAPPRLNRSPLLQALLAILRLQAADWPFRQLLAVVLNNYFQPDWPQWQAGKAAAAVEWAIRQIQLPKGRKVLLSTLERYAKSDDATAEPDGIALQSDLSEDKDAKRQRESRRRYSIAAEILNRLAKSLPSADKARSLSDWLGILQKIVDDFSLLRPTKSGPAIVSAATASTGTASSDSKFRGTGDQQAWQQLKNILSAGSQLQEWLEIDPELFTLPQFIARLRDILSIEQLPADHNDVGKVRILSAPSVRAISVPYLFVAGMAEKVFPLPALDDRIYSDAECRRLNDAGLHFVDGHGRSADEMLLFYEVITRPTRRLTLSFPALDATAQPLLASPYLAELDRCCGAGKIKWTDDISLSPVPPHADPFSPTERRTKAIAELIENQPQRFAKLMADESRVSSIVTATPGSKLPSGASNLVASLRTIFARRDQHEFSPFEGILHSTATKQLLARKFGSEHCWSVSRLDEYSQCPFQFFARNVLNLEELDELSLDTDFGRRGLLAHDAFAILHRRLNAAGKPRSPRDAPEEFLQLADGAIELLHEQIAKASPLEIALRTVDLNLITQWLQAYFGQHDNYDQLFAKINGASPDQNLRPAHFEVSFGLKPRTNEELDPLSTETPFELICDGDTVRFSGRIDRIDIGVVDGQLVFNILDYKTGSSKSFKSRNLESGVSLQLPLYALAVQELLMIDRRAVPWRVGYWFVKENGFESAGLPQFFERADFGLRETAEWQTLRGSLLNRVASLVRGIRAGNFPVFNVDEQCTSRCAYRTICRIGQIRWLGKVWNPVPSTSPQVHAAALAEAQA